MADYQLNGKNIIHTAFLSEIGERDNQEDAAGITPVAGGILAVVSDGMGGLNHGEIISRMAVMRMLSDGRYVHASAGNKALIGMLADVCSCIHYYQEKNQDYNSGATLLAVLAEPEQIHWISVGDSHIYLQRAGKILQINREHTYEYDLHLQLVNQSLTFAELEKTPKRGSLTSYLGMEQLSAIDESVVPIAVQPGDRILMATDGIFKTLSDEEISIILCESSSAETALQQMKTTIMERKKQNQDNYTAVLIDYL